MSPSRDERRRFSRIAFHRSASLEVRTGKIACDLVDISLKGALVTLPPEFAHDVGTSCTLFVSLDDESASIRMEGEIAHRQGTLVGLRCDEIDLDSIAHLRRIVELNLGNEELLHRELAALVAEREW